MKAWKNLFLEMLMRFQVMNLNTVMESLKGIDIVKSWPCPGQEYNLFYWAT